MAHPGDASLDWSKFRPMGVVLLCLVLLFPMMLELLSEDLLDVVAVILGLLTLPIWLVIGELWEELEPFQLTLFWCWVLLSWILIGAFVRKPRGLLSWLSLFNLGLAILFTWAGLYGQIRDNIDSKTLQLMIAATSVALGHGVCLAAPVKRPDPAVATGGGLASPPLPPA